MSYEFYEVQIKRNCKYFIVSLAVCISIPLIALGVPFKADNDTLGEWFQRSGSMMIVIALISEVWAIKTFNVLNPSGFVENGFNEVKKKYSYLPGRMSKFVLGLIAIGTLIWGYGDLWLD